MKFYYVEDSDVTICHECLEYCFEGVKQLKEEDGPRTCDWCGETDAEEEEKGE